MKNTKECKELKIDFDHKKPEEFVLDTFKKDENVDSELVKILK